MKGRALLREIGRESGIFLTTCGPGIALVVFLVLAFGDRAEGAVVRESERAEYQG